jgi:1,4-dihydroxy-2-naphthoate octaprenyltransferase
VKILALIRYRFFLFAGLLPYLLGAALARRDGEWDAARFGWALVGVFFAVVAVECFNEYYDSRLGTDRIFDPTDAPSVSVAVLYLGLVSFVLGAAVGLYLALTVGPAVLIFAVGGGLAALFYVGPPIRWQFRGLGELWIFLAYGPLMTLGSYYVQAGRAGWLPLLASLVPGLMVLALAIANEVPDYHQDRLVGKLNLVVRLGRRAGCYLYLGAMTACFVIIGVFSGLGVFPRVAIVALAAIPLALHSGRRALVTCESPRAFTGAARSALAAYVVATALFTAAMLT